MHSRIQPSPKTGHGGLCCGELSPLCLVVILSLALIILAPASSEGRIYKVGQYTFDIMCQNTHFSFINPNSYHLGLSLDQQRLKIIGFVEGYLIEKFFHPLVQGTTDYKITLTMKDPAMEFSLLNELGGEVTNGYLNTDQSLGYDGDHYGFICYLPKSNFPGLTANKIRLSRDWGPRFKDIKRELTADGEFHKVVIQVRRVDLWDDFNHIYVMVPPAQRKAKSRKVGEASADGAIWSPELARNEVMDLFYFPQQVELLSRWENAETMDDFRDLQDEIQNRLAALDGQIKTLNHEITQTPPPPPVDYAEKKSLLLRLSSDRDNLYRLVSRTVTPEEVQ